MDEQRYRLMGLMGIIDEQRNQLINDMKQTLIELNHIILDSYINENCYSIDYKIITDKNTVVLKLRVFYDNGNSLFDDLLIYDYDGNNLLFEIELYEKHSLKDIYEIFLSHFNGRNKKYRIKIK
jgi:hypothetical protein